MDKYLGECFNKISEMLKKIKTDKRKGNALLTITIAAAVIVGLTAYGYARLYNSGLYYFSTSKSVTIAQSYLESAMETARRQKYAQLEELTKVRQPIGQTGYFETITVGQENQGTHGNLSRNVAIQIHFGDELSPRVESSVERVNFSYLEANLYNEPGENSDGPVTAEGSYAAFALKKDSVRFAGQQVGDPLRPVYMDSSGTVQPVDFYYRGRYNQAANKLLTYSGNYIDFISKEWINDNSAVAEEKSDENSGYIRYRNGTVFAWAKGISTQSSGKHISVEKPFPFKTLQAYSTDSNYSNENNYNRLVWWIPASGLNRDVFMLNNSISGVDDTFSVFWIGYVEENNNWVDISVDEFENQKITVTVTDAVSGETSVLTNGYSGIFSKGSKYTVSISADDGYLAGALNDTGGMLNSDTFVTADKALKKCTFTVSGTEHQEIRVTGRHPQTGKLIEITSGHTVFLPEGFVWSAVIVPEANYTPGVLNSYGGVLTGNITLSASAAIPKTLRWKVTWSDNSDERFDGYFKGLMGACTPDTLGGYSLHGIYLTWDGVVVMLSPTYADGVYIGRKYNNSNRITIKLYSNSSYTSVIGTYYYYYTENTLYSGVKSRNVYLGDWYWGNYWDTYYIEIIPS